MKSSFFKGHGRLVHFILLLPNDTGAPCLGGIHIEPSLKLTKVQCTETWVSPRLRTPRPMNNETQRHAVMSWCAATGSKHVFLAGTEPAKSLVDLTEQDSADVRESLCTRSDSTLHGWTQANLYAGL